jgi:hypothetical protein
MFALVDINGAFVAMEYVFRPADRNKPGLSYLMEMDAL